MKLSPDFQRKFHKFRSDRLAWGSLWLLLVLALATLPAELFCNDRPLAVQVNGKWFFPAISRCTYDALGLPGGHAEPNWRDLEQRTKSPVAESATTASVDSVAVFLGRFDPEPGDSAAPAPFLDRFDPEPGDAIAASALPATGNGSDGGTQAFLRRFDPEPGDPTVLPAAPDKKLADAFLGVRWRFLWPPVRFGYATIADPRDGGRVSLLSPTKGRDDGHWLGTDDRGRDVLARLLYGFRACFWFGMVLALISVLTGTLLGGIQGFAGGWIDLGGQRFTEIWGSVPKLYLLMILTSLLSQRSIGLLLFVLALTSWMGLAAYTRAEFLRGRNLEYVRAARALGVGPWAIMWRHLLPNSMTPMITFLPFMITGGMLSLTSLDFLGLGVEAPYPSLGELLDQGQQNLHATWIIFPTVLLLSLTIILLTFIGTGVRTAFDPRQN